MSYFCWQFPVLFPKLFKLFDDFYYLLNYFIHIREYFSRKNIEEKKVEKGKKIINQMMAKKRINLVTVYILGQ